MSAPSGISRNSTAWTSPPAVWIPANLTEGAAWLKHITPFGYAEGVDIIAGKTLNSAYLTVGPALALAGVAWAFWYYGRKDIA